ncbi:unnamed protein product, partial [Mesorhabditis spiculigera]
MACLLTNEVDDCTTASTFEMANFREQLNDAEQQLDVSAILANIGNVSALHGVSMERLVCSTPCVTADVEEAVKSYYEYEKQIDPATRFAPTEVHSEYCLPDMQPAAFTANVDNEEDTLVEPEEGLGIDHFAEAQRSRVFELLSGYQQQTNSPFDEKNTGLNAPMLTATLGRYSHF